MLMLTTGGAQLCGCTDTGADPPSPDDTACEEVAIFRTAVHHYPSWDPSGRRIAVMSSRNQAGGLDPGLYVADLRTRSLEKLIDQSELGGFFGASELSWSPDGQRLLMWRNGGIWILDLRDKGWIQVPTGSGSPDHPQWNPDGTSVYFAKPFLHRWRFGEGAAELIEPLRVAEVGVFEPIVFSPDGEWFATISTFVSTLLGPTVRCYEVIVARPDGTGMRRLTYLNGLASSPVWLPGAREIAFEWTRDDCDNNPWLRVRHTWIVDVGTGQVRRGPADFGDARVQGGLIRSMNPSQDKLAVVWLSERVGVGTLHVLDLSGCRPIKVTEFVPR